MYISCEHKLFLSGFQWHSNNKSTNVRIHCSSALVKAVRLFLSYDQISNTKYHYIMVWTNVPDKPLLPRIIQGVFI